jgi:L-ascorbate metabolism protein UlaG (beta-lactamase superfamily)
MKLKWLGTAGFQIDTGLGVFLIDPYLSRNPQSSPVQAMQPEDISGAGQIFISHGHFDHLSDVPQIMAGDDSCVYCSRAAARTLFKDGVHSNRIRPAHSDGFSVDLGNYQARAFFSRHITFDLPLVARTLKQIGKDALRLLHMHIVYPRGQVLSWRFTIGDYSIQHFGSAGSSRRELERLAGLPLDLLLVPLQGHSSIYDIALEYVRILKPRLVIPHHHDDFYPPISRSVDARPFIEKVRENCPCTKVQVLDINDTITF